MFLLLLIHTSDYLKHLRKAIIHELVCFVSEGLDSDKYRVVAIHVDDTVWQFVLSLARQILDYSLVDANLKQIVLIRSPILHLDQLDEAFSNLEEVRIWVLRDHDHKAQGIENTLSRHF